MSKTSLTEILQKIGLSESESKVYYATLSLGPSTVLRISREAGINRTTVYSIIESLKLQGLMTIEIKGFKKLFVAEDPVKLERVLEERKNIFHNSISEFSALYNLKGGESHLKYHEGLESVKSIYESMIRDIKPHEDYMIISDHEKWMSLDEKFFKKFEEKRAKLNINIRMILQDRESSRNYKKMEKQLNVKIRFLPLGTNLITNFVVIPKRIMIHQLTPPIMAIVIENKSVIQMHTEFFEIMWNSLPE